MFAFSSTYYNLNTVMLIKSIAISFIARYRSKSLSSNDELESNSVCNKIAVS